MAADEPLAGTAPEARWWWLIEAPGPWGRRAVEECVVPAVRQLTSSSERRVLLVRQPGRRPAEGALRVWVVSGLGGVARVARVADPQDLLGWAADGAALQPDPDAPELLVCVNGKRDQCCAIDGRALIDALADDRVWECSHLGGHRFAPTALDVRTGLVYGRLDLRTARLILDSPDDPAALPYARGRSGRPAPAQVAEIARGAGASDHLEVLDVDAQGAVVRTATGTVHLRRLAGSPRPASCGAEPEAWEAWVLA